MKKILLIYNPNAGTGKVLKELSAVVDILANSEYELSVYRTKAQLDAFEKVKSDGDKFDRIVCFGGDGTLSETVKGVMTLEKKPEIAFVPAGSTNDTAKSYGIPFDTAKAAALAINGTARKIDVGVFNGENFIYVASFGEISTISAFTPRELKKALGHAAYVIEGIKVIPKMKATHMKIEHDGNEVEGDFYLGMISNSHQVAGFSKIAGANVDLSDGLFEATIFAKADNLIGYAQQIKGALIQIEDECSGALVRFKAKHLKIKSAEEIQWVTDGEDAGIHNEIEVEVKEKAVEIITNLED